MSRIFGTTLIEKYFKSHLDSDIDIRFRQNAGFFNVRNAIYSYEKFDKDKIKVNFRDIMNLRDLAIIENGKRVGIATLAEPHTISTRSGAFNCLGVKKIVERPTRYSRHKNEVNISRRFWSKGLVLRINNKHINILIICDFIYPDSYTSETKRTGANI